MWRIEVRLDHNVVEAAAVNAPSEPHFVGRSGDVAFVREKLHEASMRSGFALFIGGESGIGKSRFLRQCVDLERDASNIVTLSIDCGALHPVGLNEASLLRTAEPPIAKRKVVVFVLDDLHLLDAPDLGVVDRLVASSQKTGVALIATFLEGAPSPALAVPMARWIARGCFKRTLPPLDSPSAHVLARSVAAARPDALESRTLDSIVRASSGNPRTVIELVEHAAGSALSPLPVPALVSAVVATLRGTLPRTQMAVLTTAALIGMRFSEAWLTKLSHSGSAVAEALQAAVDTGIVAEEPLEAGFFAFRNEAYREALVRLLLSLKRRVLHERIARMLDEIGPPYGDDALAVEHWSKSGRAHELREDLARTGRRLELEGKHASAIAMYERALKQTETGDDEWVALSYELAGCYEMACDYTGAISIREALANPLDERRDATRTHANMERLLYDYIYDGRVTEAMEAAERIIVDGTIELSEAGVSAILILSVLLHQTCRGEDALRLFARVSFEAIPQPANRARYLRTRGLLRRSRPVKETLADYERSTAIALENGLHVMAASTCVEGAVAGCELGEMAVARHFLEQAAEQSGVEPGERLGIVVDLVGMLVALLEGDLANARKSLDALVARRGIGKLGEEALAALGVFLAVRVGDLALVDALFRPVLLWEAIEARAGDRCGELFWGFADVMVARGMSKELSEALEACVVREGLGDSLMSVQLCAAQYGSPEVVRVARKQVRSREGVEASTVARATLAMFDAFVGRRTGARPGTIASARRAAALYREIGWPLYEARALEIAGDVEKARRTYLQCGAQGDVRRMRRQATRKARRAPFAAPLTRREVDVASLLTKDRSNKEIADVLRLSERTVHHHVEAILGKLGIRSRRQVNQAMLSRARGHVSG
ncbi:MAG TPA: LuxR C-terminal-related transcriptional regulator [Candidatus Baltobacteraceae bacterium]|nr:LuxR C-terminal-related transcriptional regulator [Candidatus Baltobacteraceae bacterium]